MHRKTGICPLCGKEKFSVSPVNELLVMCVSCETTFNDVIWDGDANRRLNGEWFEGNCTVHQDSWEQRLFQHFNNARSWRKIRPFVQEGMKLLEVGVGSGSFLAFAQSKRLDVIGCDLSANICRFVEKKYHIRMINTPIEMLPLAPKYDAIVINHILEHTDDPRGFLENLKERLSPTGVLLVSVPNLACGEAKLKGWNSYEPYHLTFFNAATLRFVLEEGGFSILQAETHESFSGWFLAIMRTLLGVGLTKSNSAVQSVKRKNSLLRNCYYMMMIVCGILSWPLRKIQENFGYGDELIFVCRRA